MKLSLFLALCALPTAASAQLPRPAQPQNYPSPTAPQSKPVAVAPSSLPGGPLPADDDVLIIVPGGESDLPRAASKASVGGVKLDGLSEVEAASRIRKTFAPILEKRVSLWDGESNYTLTRRELGASIPAERLVARARRANGDVAVDMQLNRAHAARVLARLTKRIEERAAERNEKVVVSQNGSLERAVAAIERGEETRPTNADRNLVYVALVVTREKLPEPETPTQAPTANAPKNFPYLLGSFSTKYDATLKGRTTNLRMAARNVNGTVVGAGKIFSTNKAIGPRNAAAGWREAKMFVSGQVVSGTGAGICQCSTTIYNAALLCGFPIVERHPHTFRVMYAPPSRDAAIFWGSKDMKFRNTSGGPILVKTSVHGGRFHAAIYGTRPIATRVAVASEITSRKKGTRSTAWRIIEDASGSRRETLSKDYYRPHPH
ncbi:MAG TPA: VanW family protein [Abditibacteriaceae bacterium]|jgi:vancomycin resistance protein YoaR